MENSIGALPIGIVIAFPERRDLHDDKTLMSLCQRLNIQPTIAAHKSIGTRNQCLELALNSQALAAIMRDPIDVASLNLLINADNIGAKLGKITGGRRHRAGQIF